MHKSISIENFIVQLLFCRLIGKTGFPILQLRLWIFAKFDVSRISWYGLLIGVAFGILNRISPILVSAAISALEMSCISSAVYDLVFNFSTPLEEVSALVFISSEWLEEFSEGLPLCFGILCGNSPTMFALLSDVLSSLCSAEICGTVHNLVHNSLIAQHNQQ